ncbi:hypothetical protein [Bradyrhizobium stylosanthis]|uniref:hypothetical protein n=1 Tax=Bradyrhizobium stylosanthis TaxID=1803665 RepID=UPI000AE2C761|nr:hypothetical protein [Bradyrhizobium stylosanthis]
MVDVEKALPGYSTFDASELDLLEGTADWGSARWEEEYQKTQERLRAFLGARDPFVVLARTAARYIVESSKLNIPNRLEQSEVEIVQALLLLNGSIPKSVPTSPENFVRFWPLVSRNIHAFSRKQRVVPEKSEAGDFVSRRARTQTLYYRNLFTRPDCERTLLGILTRFDGPSQQNLGYRISELFQAMVRIVDIVLERLLAFGLQQQTLRASTSHIEVVAAINFFRSAYPLAEKVWRDRTDEFVEIERLRYAGFQMSELAFPWAFTLTADKLNSEFPREIVEALYRLSLKPGDLSSFDPQHIYLNNPIWRKPYVRRGDDLFVALPQLIFSFPFAIIEEMIDGRRDLEVAYENARAEYLEEAVVHLVGSAIPSARVYRSVMWDDPKTGQAWENDVLVAVGNFIFVFEAKSGRINEVARRGGELSLVRNFRELFVEPGIQGWRLQNYLDEHQRLAVLRSKADGSLVDLGLDRPKVVFRFSVCMEHFASLTSAKHYFMELGLVTNDTAWAPVLSLGELQMICRYLDSEVSLIHYLTRRATLEELLNFEGDEQDLLSLYLTNGLCLDASALEGRRVMFHNADSLVRRNKVPRINRREFEIHGVQLSPLWSALVRELYRDDGQRHRFDIINVVLNQLPPALAEFERRVRRFKRGEPHGGEDLLMTRFVVGKKVFVLALYLAKKMPDAGDWKEKGRGIVGMFHEGNEMVECAAFIFLRRSKEATFDGVSFYRYGFRPEPEDASKPTQ